MDKIIRVGVDLDKNVMQLHGGDGQGPVVVEQASTPASTGRENSQTSCRPDARDSSCF